jgi:hypothetical protein
MKAGAEVVGRFGPRAIAAFHRLVGQIMRREPYQSAHRVFLITDNGSCHRGRRAADRLHAKWANIVLVHTPVHASWLDQLEIYLSIVQWKLLTPGSFNSLADLRRKLMAFQESYQRSAKPFKWTFTRRDLHALLAKLKRRRYRRHEVAASQYVTVIANQGTKLCF